MCSDIIMKFKLISKTYLSKTWLKNPLKTYFNQIIILKFRKEIIIILFLGISLFYGVFRLCNLPGNLRNIFHYILCKYSDVCKSKNKNQYLLCPTLVLLISILPDSFTFYVFTISSDTMYLKSESTVFLKTNKSPNWT